MAMDLEVTLNLLVTDTLAPVCLGHLPVSSLSGLEILVRSALLGSI